MEARKTWFPFRLRKLSREAPDPGAVSVRQGH